MQWGHVLRILYIHVCICLDQAFGRLEIHFIATIVQGSPMLQAVSKRCTREFWIKLRINILNVWIRPCIQKEVYHGQAMGASSMQSRGLGFVLCIHICSHTNQRLRTCKPIRSDCMHESRLLFVIALVDILALACLAECFWTPLSLVHKGFPPGLSELPAYHLNILGYEDQRSAINLHLVWHRTTRWPTRLTVIQLDDCAH
mmetsp:Transcript_26991/g.48795  ORF Transcript_26991/g.48795 Transcript_26991/m.48795 type:complete len:201 (+) Transcript_26991:763-1365(+)